MANAFLRKCLLDFKTFYVDNRNVLYTKYYRRYKDFTMIRAAEFTDNLRLCKKFKHVDGIIVE